MEQLRRGFEEFRSSSAVRLRPPEELWGAAAKLARRDGIEAAPASTPESAQKRAHCLLRATAGGEHWYGDELSDGSGIAARCKLRLELKATPTGKLAELIRAFANVVKERAKSANAGRRANLIWVGLSDHCKK